MATLTIIGDVKQLEIIKKKSRVITAKHDLSVSITDEKPKKVVAKKQTPNSKK